MIELILSLLKNLLLIPDSTNEPFDHLQDDLISSFSKVSFSFLFSHRHQANFFDFLMVLIKNIHKEENYAWNFLILEILYLILYRSPPEDILSTHFNRFYANSGNSFPRKSLATKLGSMLDQEKKRMNSLKSSISIRSQIKSTSFVFDSPVRIFGVFLISKRRGKSSTRTWRPREEFVLLWKLFHNEEEERWSKRCIFIRILRSISSWKSFWTIFWMLETFWVHFDSILDSDRLELTESIRTSLEEGLVEGQDARTLKNLENDKLNLIWFISFFMDYLHFRYLFESQRDPSFRLDVSPISSAFNFATFQVVFG